jgi:hypothetical protein
MVRRGLRRFAARLDGWIMRRVIVIAAAGLSLGGCGSMSWDAFKSTAPPVQLQLLSNPPGADARTSLGPGCTTPCVVTIPVPEGSEFTVAYALDKFQPATLTAHVIRTPGEFMSSGSARIDPNPVTAELQRVGPPPKPVRKKHAPHGPKKPRARKGAAAAPPAAESPFPNQAPAAAPAAPPAPAPPPAR